MELQASYVRAEPAHPRDPDASIVGDLPAGQAFVASSHLPSYPSVSAAVMANNLVSAPKPDYPTLARLAHVDGPVVLRAEITPDGEVSGTEVISGHRLLRRAAEEAVRRWRYRPYEVDGSPIGVATTITVRFQHQH
jgi:protein TonB